MRLRRDHGPRAGMVNSVSSSISQDTSPCLPLHPRPKLSSSLNVFVRRRYYSFSLDPAVSPRSLSFRDESAGKYKRLDLTFKRVPLVICRMFVVNSRYSYSRIYFPDNFELSLQYTG